MTQKQRIQNIIDSTFSKTDVSLDDYKFAFGEIDSILKLEGSTKKNARSQVSGFFETALEKFYQIKLEELGYGDNKFFGKESPNKKHWFQPMQAALINAEKSNRGMSRGFIFFYDELEVEFDNAKLDAFDSAISHLNIREKVTPPDTSLVDIYKYASLAFPNNFTNSRNFK